MNNNDGQYYNSFIEETKKVLARRYEFNEEVKEIIVLSAEYGCTSTRRDEKNIWEINAGILAYIDLETNELIEDKGHLMWLLTDEDNDTFKAKYPNALERESIYKLQVRKNKYMNDRFLVLEVLEENVQNETLCKVLEEFKRPVTITDTLFGELTLDKRFSQFEGEVKWIDRYITISIGVDISDKSSWDNSINQAKEICEISAETDKKLREFAASELTGLAIDWLIEGDDSIDLDLIEDDDELMTEEEFSERVSIYSISIEKDGSYSIYLDDGDLFLGHTITVNGDLQNGLDSAQMG